jgi:hypothetical protein
LADDANLINKTFYTTAILVKKLPCTFIGENPLHAHLSLTKKINIMKNIYPFLFIALFLSACSNYLLRKGTENVKSITNIPLRPGTSQVDLFFKDDLPAKPFYKVQMIEAVGYNDASYDELLKKLTTNARQAGLDAVLVLDKVQEVKYEDLLELNTNTTDWALFKRR